MQIALSRLKSFTAFSLLICLFMVTSSSEAADLYRCGNAYQDTPCQGNSASKPVKKLQKTETSSNRQSSVTKPILKVDNDCRNRGETSKKISWDREVGVTKESQMEQGKYPSDLITEVYNHRGSSLEIKHIIEQNCMQEKILESTAGRIQFDSSKLDNPVELKSK